jgi:hypothetical protein
MPRFASAGLRKNQLIYQTTKGKGKVLREKLFSRFISQETSELSLMQKLSE